MTRDTPKFDKVLIHSNWSSLRGTYWAKFQQTKTYWFVNHIFWEISDAISSMLHLQDQRSIYARVLHAMAQFVLKIEKLSHIIETAPIIEMAQLTKSLLWPLLIVYLRIPGLIWRRGTTYFVENKTPAILSGDSRRATSELSCWTPATHF